jgi:hypothetical protein
MTPRVLAGSLLSYAYNHWLTHFPSHYVRRAYLRAYLGACGTQTWVQMGCRFLNGRKVFFGPRNAINFGCLFDGRRYAIRTGSDVSIGPEATILTLGHDPQSPDFADQGGEVIIGDRVWIVHHRWRRSGPSYRHTGNQPALPARLRAFSHLKGWQVFRLRGRAAATAAESTARRSGP